MTPAVAPQAEQPLSQMERLVNVFTAPTKTFRDINRSASWWLPSILVYAMLGAMFFVIVQKIGAGTLADSQVNQMSKITASMDQSQLEQMRLSQEKSIQRQWLTTPLFAFIFTFIIALVLMASFNFGAGQSVSYWKSFAVVVYAGVPGILKSLLVMIVVFAGVSPEGFDLMNPLASNIGAFLPSTAPFFARMFLSGIDVFMIWTLFLTALGFTCISKVKTGTAMAIVFGWYLLFMVVLAGGLSLIMA